MTLIPGIHFPTNREEPSIFFSAMAGRLLSNP